MLFLCSNNVLGEAVSIRGHNEARRDKCKYSLLNCLKTPESIHVIRALTYEVGVFVDTMNRYVQIQKKTIRYEQDSILHI